MSASKSYDSVAALLDDITEDDEFKAGVKNKIQGQRLAAMLFSMRCREGLTQEQIAKRIGCSQSHISKLEHSTFDRLTVKDLEQYSRAIGVQLTITFQQRMNAVESVKHHFFQIKAHLDKLRELARGDSDIIKGVDQFYNEYFVNTLKQFLDAKKALSELKPDKSSSTMRVVAEEPPTDEELQAIMENQPG